jgi:protein-disulfide isomerase
MAYQPTTPWVPALIVGGAILAAGLTVKMSLDKTTAQLEGIQKGLAETKVALSEVAQAQKTAAPPQQQQRPRGPDPNKRYTLKTAGRPTKGPSNARVEIVEFSEFQ